MLNEMTKEIKMTKILNRECFTEDEVHQFSAFASDIGISPMDYVRLTEFETNLGNGMKMFAIEKNSEVTKFAQVGGCVYVTIYND
jgi:hypothetical protein